MTSRKHSMFKSSLAPYLDQFVREKRAVGYRYDGAVYLLTRFDRFLAREAPNDETLTRTVTRKWLAKGPLESGASQQRRFTVVRQFALFLCGGESNSPGFCRRVTRQPPRPNPEPTVGAPLRRHRLDAVHILGDLANALAGRIPVTRDAKIAVSVSRRLVPCQRAVSSEPPSTLRDAPAARARNRRRCRHRVILRELRRLLHPWFTAPGYDPSVRRRHPRRAP